MNHTLRPYQDEAVECVFEEFKEHQATLLVLPTGCGKTQIFSEVVRRMQPGRAIVLAHRAELIYQASKRIEAFGIQTAIEMASMSAGEWFGNRAPCIVSTVQTQGAGGEGGRMTKFNPKDFALLVVDEAHHYTSPSYKAVIDYYRNGNPNLKVLGVTATPDRADEEALGKVFQSVAYDYEVLDAINDGWLVPIEQLMVEIEGLDFSGVHTTAGDLNRAELANIMEDEKNLQGVAGSSIDIIGNRRSLAFTASVKQAEMLANIFNRHREGMAAFICGETDKEERAKILRAFANGDFQVLTNCGVLTEGYDDSGIEVILQARPTKSRSLYCQIVGRATRPLPGVVDGPETSQDRRAAISASKKPSCLVVDYVGSSGKHKLMSTADILGGNMEDDVLERVVAKARKAGKAVRMDEAMISEAELIKQEIEEKRKLDAARKMHLIAKAKYTKKSVNPFDVLDIEPVRARGWDNGKQMSPGQLAMLQRNGIDVEGMPYSQQHQIFHTLIKRITGKLATYKQVKCLAGAGYPDADKMSFSEASEKMAELIKNNWKRPVAAVSDTNGEV